jgi:hypothetical protein
LVLKKPTQLTFTGSRDELRWSLPFSYLAYFLRIYAPKTCPSQF